MADFSASYVSPPGIYSYTQNPSDATYIATSSPSASAGVRYFQRVFSSGLNDWCYYSTLNAVDPAPLSSATTTNWTGSISNPQVVQAVLVSP